MNHPKQFKTDVNMKMKLGENGQKIFMDSGLSVSVEKPGPDPITSLWPGMRIVRWPFAYCPEKRRFFLPVMNMGWFLRLFKPLDHICNMLSNVFLHDLYLLRQKSVDILNRL